MATEVTTRVQSRSEIRTYPVSFEDDLLEGVFVSSAVVVHTPPADDPTDPAVAVESPVVNVTVGPLEVLGDHFVDIRAVLSDGEVSSVRLKIPVTY